MKDNTNEIQLFVQEQVALELELSKIIELILELDEYDFKSSNEFYKNKDKYDVLIDYSIKLNNYDYAKFEYYYNILSENMPEGREMLDDFILKLQDIIFDLNVVLNTYIENIINHEMAMDLLDKKSGEVNLREISFHVGNLDIISKRKYTDKKICELVGVKAFSGAFNNLTKSPYKNIILDFYFNRTKGKFNSLTDYKKYLHFKQLLFRFNDYSDFIGKNVYHNIFDLEIQKLYMEYLTNNNIFALEKGFLLIYDISNNYPISGNIKTILRSSFSMFGIKILPNGKIDYGTLEDDKGTQELKKLIKITADILFYGQYEKYIEDYKNKYNLDNDEFELFKEYRFTSMFLEGFKVMELLNNKRFDLIEKKLNKSDYFKILKYYGIYHNSVFGSYGDFIKSELKNILDKIDNANINALPDTYKYDLEYIKQNVGHTYKSLKK